MTSTARISIVDDDASVRVSLQELLHTYEYSVRTFPSSEAFLAGQASTATDCLILDVRMPGMTGLELYAALRSGGSTIPVIFVTSLSDEKFRARALADGAIAYLTKPCSEEALLNAIKHALARPRD